MPALNKNPHIPAPGMSVLQREIHNFEIGGDFNKTLTIGMYKSDDCIRDLTHTRLGRLGRRGRRLVQNVFLFYVGGIWQLFGTKESLSVLKLTPAEYATNAFNSK